MKSRKSWIKNPEKPQNRQNVPENIPNWALPSNRVIQHRIDRKNKHKEIFPKIFNLFVDEIDKNDEFKAYLTNPKKFYG